MLLLSPLSHAAPLRTSSAHPRHGPVKLLDGARPTKTTAGREATAGSAKAAAEAGAALTRTATAVVTRAVTAIVTPTVTARLGLAAGEQVDPVAAAARRLAAPPWHSPAH